MTQWVKAPVTKPDHLILIPGTPHGGSRLGESLLILKRL